MSEKIDRNAEDEKVLNETEISKMEMLFNHACGRNSFQDLPEVDYEMNRYSVSGDKNELFLQ